MWIHRCDVDACNEEREATDRDDLMVPRDEWTVVVMDLGLAHGGRITRTAFICPRHGFEPPAMREIDGVEAREWMQRAQAGVATCSGLGCGSTSKAAHVSFSPVPHPDDWSQFLRWRGEAGVLAANFCSKHDLRLPRLKPLPTEAAAILGAKSGLVH